MKNKYLIIVLLLFISTQLNAQFLLLTQKPSGYYTFTPQIQNATNVTESSATLSGLTVKTKSNRNDTLATKLPTRKYIVLVGQDSVLGSSATFTGLTENTTYTYYYSMFVFQNNNDTAYFKSSDNTFTTLDYTDSLTTQFVFNDVTEADLSTNYESNIVTLSNLDSAYLYFDYPVPATAYYNLNSAGWISLVSYAPIKVYSGTTLQLRVTSQAICAAGVSIIARVASIKDTFTVITNTDDIPNSFAFTDVTNASLSTIYTDTLIITGMYCDGIVSITGGSAFFNINNSAYTQNASYTNNDTIVVRMQSSNLYSTSVNTTLTIGGVSDTWTITTSAEPGSIPSNAIYLSNGEALKLNNNEYLLLGD